jgi:glycosyltransferase involved in cell wall biosynthesis
VERKGQSIDAPQVLPSSSPQATRAQGSEVAGPISVAYLTSQYPTLSMSFFLREVLELRALGLRLDVVSVNLPDRPEERLTAEEAAEARNAYHLKRHGLKGVLAANIKTLSTNFAGYWRGLGMALRLGGLDLKRLFFHFMYFMEALMVGVWMKQKRHHHLHVHLGSQAATVGMYVRCIFGVGFSITVHGPDEFYDATAQCLTEKIAAADFICCISFFCRSQLMKFSPYEHWHKLIVSRLGVNTEDFSPKPVRQSPSTFVILCVGRLVPAKGQHQLIDAVDRLARQGRSVRLHLVGAGPDYDSLRHRASQCQAPETIVFEGPVNHDRIRALYDAADLFCIPSFAEGIPIVLMEAMAMGIPCVSTQIAGIPELIRNGVDGLLVPASDLDGLASALATLMDEPELRQRLSNSSRARIAEHYDLRRNVEKLAAIFAERTAI